MGAQLVTCCWFHQPPSFLRRNQAFLFWITLDYIPKHGSHTGCPLYRFFNSGGSAEPHNVQAVLNAGLHSSIRTLVHSNGRFKERLNQFPRVCTF